MAGEETWRSIAAEIRALATPLGRAQRRRLSLEGTRLFERALRAGVRIERAVTTAAFGAEPDRRGRALLAALEASGCELALAPEEAMDELTGGRSLGALVGVAALPAPQGLGEVLAAAPRRPARVLVAVDVLDPGNVGALARTALASGAAALVTTGGTDAFHPKAVRTSMGSLFRLPVVACPDAAACLAACAAHGLATVGAVSSGGLDPAELPVQGRPLAVLLGSEAFGLPAELVARLDHLATIPMATAVDSLSINAAAAVLLYALGRGAPEAQSS